MAGLQVVYDGSSKLYSQITMGYIISTLYIRNVLRHQTLSYVETRP